MKIRTRFMLFLLIFVIIVFAVMYIVSTQISRNRIMEDIGNHITTAVEFKAQSIDELLKTYIEFTELISIGFTIKDPFTTNFEHEIKLSRAKTRVNNIINKRSSISRIRILDIDGIVVISSHDDVGINLSERDIFIKGREETYINYFHYSEFTDEYVFSIATPIYVNGQMSGVLVINFVAEDQLFPIMTDKTGMVHSTNFYLLNNDYFLLSPTKYNDKILETKIFPEQIEHCHEDHLLNDIPEMDLVGSVFYSNHRGDTVMGTHIYIPSMQWFLLVEVDESEIMIPIMKYRNILTILFLIVLIISIGVSYLISLFITKPIKQLEKGVQEIISGNTFYKVATNSRDEIGQLSRIFDNMTNKLMKSQMELEHDAGILEDRVIDRTNELEKKIIQSKHQRIATLNVLNDLDKTNIDLKLEIGERKKIEETLKKKLNELEIFNEVTVGRELKINEHRKEINELLEKLGKKAKYEIPV